MVVVVDYQQVDWGVKRDYLGLVLGSRSLVHFEGGLRTVFEGRLSGMDPFFSMGYRWLRTVGWCVELAPWSFVFNGLDRVLVSFPIEKFPDAKTQGVGWFFIFLAGSLLVSGVSGAVQLPVI